MSYKNVIKAVRELMNKVDNIERDVEEIKNKVLNNKPIESDDKKTFDGNIYL